MAETVPASRKLQRDTAVALLDAAMAVHVAKGRKVQEFSGDERLTDAAPTTSMSRFSATGCRCGVDALLGTTGNLRAPTLRVGGTLLVGFNEAVYAGVFRLVTGPLPHCPVAVRELEKSRFLKINL